MTEDNTTEVTNVVGILLSMLGILMKYKTAAWLGVLVAGVSFANLRANYDGKQVMSTFMLSLSAVFMCYLTNPQPISMYFLQQQAQQAAAAAAAAASGGSPPPPVANTR